MIILVIIGLLMLVGFGSWCAYMAWNLLQVGLVFGDLTAVAVAAFFAIVCGMVWWAAFYLVPFQVVMSTTP